MFGHLPTAWYRRSSGISSPANKTKASPDRKGREKNPLKLPLTVGARLAECLQRSAGSVIDTLRILFWRFPMFRDRPLTWLFVAATVCVDFAIAVGSPDALANLWQWGFCLGQSAVLGCWLVVGTRHRLERGALFVVAQLVLATVLSFPFLNGSLIVWGRMLAPSALYGTMAALGVFVGKICFFRFRVTRDANRSYVIRYSLMEIFGWTVVVAIAAAALRQGRLITMFQVPELLLFFLGLGLNIGLVTVLLIDHNNRYRYSLSFVIRLFNRVLSFCVENIARPDSTIRFGFYRLCGICSDLDCRLSARRAFTRTYGATNPDRCPKLPTAAC